MVPEIIHIPTPQKLTGYSRGVIGSKEKKKNILLAGDIIIIAAYIPQ